MVEQTLSGASFYPLSDNGKSYIRLTTLKDEHEEGIHHMLDYYVDDRSDSFNLEHELDRRPRKEPNAEDISCRIVIGSIKAGRGEI